jgi:Zn-dependent peptidase ImmA (M78 family)
VVAVAVKGKVLEWARKQRGLDLPRAAKATGLPQDKIAAFENEDDVPTLGDLDAIASGYEIAFGALLMPDVLPEVTRPKIVDYRVAAGEEPPPWSPELSVAADIVQEQVATLADLLDADPSLATPIGLPELQENSSTEEMAAEERLRLDVDINQQLAIETPAQAFHFWRHVIEREGVLVYLLDLGDWRACRGYSVFDYANLPAVVINNQEVAQGARLYSLIHEYCHLLLRKPGISDHNRRRSTEAYCNSFAAFFLMPRATFIGIARYITRDDYWTDAQLRRLGAPFGTSMSACALHLEQTGMVRQGLYAAKQKEWSVYKPQKKQRGPTIEYAERQLNRLGERHVGLVLNAMQRGSINQLEAFDLTEVNPKHYPALRATLKKRQEKYGAA